MICGCSSDCRGGSSVDIDSEATALRLHGKKQANMKRKRSNGVVEVRDMMINDVDDDRDEGKGEEL